jgi:hypothetical protein
VTAHTATVALDWLRANLGMGENPSNHNLITEWFGIGDLEWCAMTVSRALCEAFGDADRWQVPGVEADFTKGIAAVPRLRLHFDTVHRFDQNPQVGDVVIIIHSAGSDGDHTGMVEEVLEGGSVRTIEGNQGDALVQTIRHPNEILGFCHPPYDPEPDPRKALPEMITYDIATADGSGQTFLLRSQGAPVFLARGTDVKDLREKAGVPHAGELSGELHRALMGQ